ncbi:MAG: DUF1552 domain-containing protein [Verrucomicrobiae bacterium]|nr:DUF1552 domain-containing protein [Verrucomicrobiae bacterium]
MPNKKTWNLSRRTALKGVAGVTLGLPWLETLLWGAEKTEAAKAPLRFGVIYQPNGINPYEWTPTGEGAGYQLSKTLRPLAPIRDEVLVLTHLNHDLNKGRDRPTSGHYGGTSNFLVGRGVKRSMGSDIECGVSVDQAAAKHVGHQTLLPSLELSTEAEWTGVDTGERITQLYGNSISWLTPTTPLARERIPRLAFDRLFGKTARLGDTRSVIDLTRESIQGLAKQVSRDDQHRLDEYLTSVRSLEKKLEFNEKNQRPIPETLLQGRVPEPGQAKSHDEHLTQMIDIMTLAFQTDRTRVATFMMGRSSSGIDFSFVDKKCGGLHGMAHHAERPAKLEGYQIANEYCVGKYVEFLQKLHAIQEGERSVLDNSMILFGNNMRDGNSHTSANLPILLAGRGGGQLNPGRHIVYEENTRLCNLYLAILKRMGLSIDQFNESTGELPGLG